MTDSFPPLRPASTNVAAASLVGAATAAAYSIPDPLTRALTLCGLAVLLYVVGLFQPRPR